MRLLTIVFRSLALRCPHCGRDPIFRRWFSMNPACRHCGTRFEREAGFYLGSIYVNYGLTALLVAVVYPILVFRQSLDEQSVLLCAAAFVLLFPLLFFRHARAIWLAFDEYFDPKSDPEKV